MASDTVTVNENLLRIDNLYNALNYLFEEIQTKKDQIVQAEDVKEKVIQQMNTRDFKEQMLSHIRSVYGEGLFQEVAYIVMEKIDEDITAFINARVDERLRQVGVNVPESTVGG